MKKHKESVREEAMEKIITLAKESDDYKVNLLFLFVMNVLIDSTMVNEVNELNLFEIDQLLRQLMRKKERTM